MSNVTHLTVRGFKSITALDRFELGSLNVLIGPNGAGKSNLLGLFRMMGALANGRLRLFVAKEDGPDALLYRGRKHTSKMEIELAFPNLSYRVGLTAVGEHLVLTHEETNLGWIGKGHHESDLSVTERTESDPFARFLREAMSDWRVFHFHDTTIEAGMRQSWSARDNIQLHSTGRNIAPFLRVIKERHPDNYRQILHTVRLAAPYIEDFLYRGEASERLGLEWLEKDVDPGILGPRQLSDGTIRLICLATLLLQPTQMQPSTILIDEPELGLHPFALTLLAELLEAASASRQILVSTQSADLVNEFEAKHIITVGRRDGRSEFNRPDEHELREWLAEYAIGDLWRMNVVGGSPSR
ncbi:MAG: AAA family ATPase [Gammaproteobacteria bacterium]|nr:AAA family ATPase [Gammaproteobacteria bacterium]